MNSLRQALADYLSLRRSLGYKLERPEKLLNQFLDYLDERGASTITTDLALSWARLPRDASPLWWAHRLTVVRGFAGYLHVLNEAHEVPPTDVLPWKSHRANPFLYTDTEIAALIGAAATLRFPLRVATYQTLIALLAVTGMRVGEAIGLDADGFDNDRGVLLVRKGKGGCTRQLPLHPSTTAAVRAYLQHPDRRSAARTTALLISPAGTRLLYCNAQWTFQKLLRQVGIEARSSSCRPRIHDLRHSFAVSSLLNAYTGDLDIDRRLTLLATYLGHRSPRAARPHRRCSVMTALAPTLQAFFTDRLRQQRHASDETVRAYRDTWRLLLGFAATRTGKQPSSLDIGDIDGDLIAAFLNHLEHDRHNSIRTRNARLSAIHSLFHFAAPQHPEHAATISRVLAMPSKRFERALVTYLTTSEVDALLAAPDPATWTGRRDRTFICCSWSRLGSASPN